jgi:hypothetical protein
MIGVYTSKLCASCYENVATPPQIAPHYSTSCVFIIFVLWRCRRWVMHCGPTRLSSRYRCEKILWGTRVLSHVRTWMLPFLFAGSCQCYKKMLYKHGHFLGAVGTALQTNTTLQELRMWENTNVTELGWLALLKGIKVCIFPSFFVPPPPSSSSSSTTSSSFMLFVVVFLSSSLRWPRPSFLSLFYFILFYFILFYFILFYFILFYIFPWMQVNKGLLIYRLGKNRLNFTSVVTALADVIRYNTTLVELFPTNSGLVDADSVLLAEALVDNRSLTKLSLHCNHVAEVGATRLANVFLQVPGFLCASYVCL